MSKLICILPTLSRGSSIVEFVVVSPLLMLIGLGTVQAALIYHAKTTLNYATFEAARAGAVNHALVPAMRKELGYRLAPIFGGDGSREKAARAIGKSILSALDPVKTRFRVINPTQQVFDDWGEFSLEAEGRRAIPNSHLKHRNAERANTDKPSGVNLHDANLLKIEVTHGYGLKIPLINSLLTKALSIIDPGNISFYAQGQFPLKSVATVRMQNEAWESDELLVAAAEVPAHLDDNIDSAALLELVSDVPAQQPDPAGSCDEHGLHVNLKLPVEERVDPLVCGADTPRPTLAEQVASEEPGKDGANPQASDSPCST